MAGSAWEELIRALESFSVLEWRRSRWHQSIRRHEGLELSVTVTGPEKVPE